MLVFKNNILGKTLCIITSLMISSIGSSQTEINPSSFFAKGISSIQQPTTTDKKDINFPWIEKYEIRTETRKFDLARQEYTFRITPSTPQKRKAQKAIYEHLRDTPDFKALDSYCDVSALIHADWLMLYATSKYLNLYEKLKIVIKDKEQVYDKMMSALELDIEKLIKLEMQKSDIDIKMALLERRKEGLQNKYDLEKTSAVPDNIITIDNLYSILSQGIKSGQNIDSNKILHDIELVEKELALERAEEKQIFDFGQIKYQGPQDDLLRERISLGIGFLIPNSGNQKLKILELELEQESLKKRINTQNQEKEQKLNVQRTSLIELLDTYNAMQTIVDKERRKLLDIAERLSSKQGESPLVLLDIEERHIRTQLESFEAKEEILFDYLKYLDRSGKLCSKSSLELITKKLR